MCKHFSLIPSLLIVGVLACPEILHAQSFEERLEQALTLEQEAAEASASGDVNGAIDKCRRAALQLRELGIGEQDQAVCWVLVGSLEKDRDNHKEAVEALRSSLQLLERLQPPPGLLAKNHLYLAQALVGLGVMELKLGRLPQAAGLVEEAVTILRRTGVSTSDLAAALQNLAAIYQRQGELDKALSLIQEVINLEPEAPDYNTLGSIYLGKGDYVHALEAFERAEELYQREGNQLGVWITRTDKAQVYYRRGQMVEALDLWEKAAQAFRSLGNTEQLPAALSGVGSIYHDQGRNEEALKAHQEALELHRRSRDKSGEAVALNNLATVDLSLGLWDQGLAKLEESLAILREIGDRQGEVTALLNSAVIHAQFGRLEEALTRFKKSLDLSREIHDPTLEAMSLQHISQTLGILGRQDEALDHAKEALAKAQEIGNRSIELVALRMKGIILLERGERKRALEVLGRAQALSHEIGDRATEAEILTIQGIVLLRGYEEDAAKRVEKALAILRETGDLHFLGTAFLTLGIIEQKNGRHQEAIQAYREAVQADEQISGQTDTDELLQSLLGGNYLAYQQLIRSLVVTDDVVGAFAVAEQARSRTLLRQLGNRRIDIRKGADRQLVEEEGRLQGRLRDLDRQIGEERRKPFDQQNRGVLEYLARETDLARRQYENVLIRLKQTNPEYASLIRPSTLGLTEVQKLIDPETTLIEYFSLDEQLLVWVIERDSYRLFRLPVPAGGLAEHISLLRNRIASRESEGGVSVNLYRHLFAPLEPSIHHENLVIVPHGALHSLPFAALLDGKGSPLVERYRITLLPSASVLPFLREKRSPNEGRLLALGDPDGSLTHAGEEARAVAALYGKEPFLRAKATESTVRKEGGRIDVLHLASHAVYDPARPLFSRIELAPGEGEDGHLELHEVFNLDLAGANLVVLSGCGTARGNPTGGDDLTGFTRAFLYAGAPSVLATLWPVDDEVSSALMASFHRRLRQGSSPAKALQAAQLEIGKEEKWRSPYFWAGYTLTGDGG